MPLPIKDRATALIKTSPISFFALYDWIILNLLLVVFQPLGRLGYLLDWIEGGLEIETLYLVFGPNIHLRIWLDWQGFPSAHFVISHPPNSCSQWSYNIVTKTETMKENLFAPL